MWHRLVENRLKKLKENRIYEFFKEQLTIYAGIYKWFPTSLQ